MWNDLPKALPADPEYTEHRRAAWAWAGEDLSQPTFLHVQLGVYEYPRAAITKHPKLGDLNNRHLFSHSSEGQKSKIKVSARLVPSGGSEGGSVPGLSPSIWWFAGDPVLPCGHRSSLCLHLQMAFFLRLLCVSLFFKDATSHWISVLP